MNTSAIWKVMAAIVVVSAVCAVGVVSWRHQRAARIRAIERKLDEIRRQAGDV